MSITMHQVSGTASERHSTWRVTLPDVPAESDWRALYANIRQLTTGGGETSMIVRSRRVGGVSWARNRIAMSTQMRVLELEIFRSIRGNWARSLTTRLDPEGLRDAIQAAEEGLSILKIDDISNPHNSVGSLPLLRPVLWSDATAAYDADARTGMVESLIAPAEAAGLMSAGQFEVTADTHMTITSGSGVSIYYPVTTAQCSITVRDPQGTASGWAGANHTDLTKIDPAAIAAVALDKCQRSLKPQAVEPGRYTVVLEPQAVGDLLAPIFGALPAQRDAEGRNQHLLSRRIAEMGIGAFAHRNGGTRIGEQMLDRRLMIQSDPMDPAGGFLPYVPQSGTPYRPVAWFDRGILKELSYDVGYAVESLDHDRPLECPSSFRLSAIPGVRTTSMADMIAKTERGVLVTRFSGIEAASDGAILCSGYTRDGLWLIEHGKVAHPIKNFRIRESPLFVLNRVLDIGEPQRVYAPGDTRVVPAIRADDFSFITLSDAI